MSRRSRVAGLVAGWSMVALTSVSPMEPSRIAAEEPTGVKEAGMDESNAELAKMLGALSAPVRFGQRAAVRMSGAIDCKAAGYFGRPSDKPTHHYFNLSSLELVGPRAHPAWQVQIQRDGGEVSRVSFTRKDVPYMDGIGLAGKRGDKGWSATYSDDGRVLTLRALLLAKPGEPPLDFQCRVEWPTAREPAPVPAEVRSLLEKHTRMVARKFSTWDFGREKDPDCASVTLDSEEQARAALVALRADLPKGWVAFLGSRRWLDKPEIKGVELVVAPGSGWPDMLRAARLDPVNSGLTTEAAVRWLTEYERALGIDVILASTDSLEFAIRGEPYNGPRFVDDLTHLCPDLLDGPRSDIEEMVQAGKISLWWD